MKVLCKNCLREVEMKRGMDKCPYCRKPLEGPKIGRQEDIPRGKPIELPEQIVISCPVCSKRYRLPTSKIPRDTPFKISCKGCGSPIVTDYNRLVADYIRSNPNVTADSSPATEKIRKPSQFFVRNRDGEFGPMTLSEARKRCEQGFLRKHDQVKKDDGRFKPAWHYPELRPYLKEEEPQIISPPPKVKAVREIESDWTLMSFVIGIAAGMVGGLVFSLLPIVLSFVEGTPAVLSPRSDLGWAARIGIQILFWLVIGGFQGSLLSFFEAFAAFRRDEAVVWKRSRFWIGTVTGGMSGLILFIIDVMQPMQLLFFIAYFTLMTFLILLAHERLEKFVSNNVTPKENGTE